MKTWNDVLDSLRPVRHCLGDNTLESPALRFGRNLRLTTARIEHRTLSVRMQPPRTHPTSHTAGGMPLSFTRVQPISAADLGCCRAFAARPRKLCAKTCAKNVGICLFELYARRYLIGGEGCEANITSAIPRLTSSRDKKIRLDSVPSPALASRVPLAGVLCWHLFVSLLPPSPTGGLTA